MTSTVQRLTQKIIGCCNYRIRLYRLKHLEARMKFERVLTCSYPLFILLALIIVLSDYL